MKIFAVLALCLALVTAGEVDISYCGGAGTVIKLQCSGCEGPVCLMKPGTPYPCEAEVALSSSSESLSLKVTAIYLGLPIIIIDAPLPGGPYSEGELITLRFSVTPNEILSGNTLPIQTELSQTHTGLVEICFGIQCQVL